MTHPSSKICRPALPDRATFDELHLTVAPGDHYGLEFPISPAMLAEFGPSFLTRAFRASGVLSADNEVTEIALKPITVHGASERALLTVAYARHEPGLRTELFAKFPPAGPDHKFGLARMGGGEVTIQRFARDVGLPVTLPEYYFGDFCERTTNYILITEQIPFGVSPVEPAHRKAYDHEIRDVDAHYRLLAQSLAKLVAAHKRGDLGPDVDTLFPPGGATRDFHPIPNAPERIDRLIKFVSQTAPHLFIAEASDPAFLARLRSDLLFGLENKDAILSYLHQNNDYTGLCHPNLNVDNAWYWRDPSGELHAGLLDWGGAGQMSVAQALSSMMMMPEPEKYCGLVELVFATFLEKLAEGCGIALDPDELRLQYKASLFSTAIHSIITIVVDACAMIPDDAWTSMPNRFDPLLLDSGMIATVIWIDNILREWRDDITPGDACRQIMALLYEGSTGLEYLA